MSLGGKNQCNTYRHLGSKEVSKRHLLECDNGYFSFAVGKKKDGFGAALSNSIISWRWTEAFSAPINPVGLDLIR